MQAETPVALLKFSGASMKHGGIIWNEPRCITSFMRLWKAEDFPAWCSKKYSGIPYEIHRDGTRVAMYTANGIDQSARFPGIVAELLAMPAQKFVVLAEVEQWILGKHTPKDYALDYANSTSPADDTAFVANIHDCILFDDVNDVHMLAFHERHQLLLELGIRQSTDEVPDITKKLNLVPQTPVDLIGKLEEQITLHQGKAGSRGAIIKNNRPDAKPMTYHNSAVIHAIVLSVHPMKEGILFQYSYGVDYQNMSVPPDSVRSLNGKLYHEVGKTALTTIEVESGDIILVDLDSLDVLHDRKAGTISISSSNPRLAGMVNKKHPNSIGEAMKVAEAGLILTVKELSEFGDTMCNGVSMENPGGAEEDFLLSHLGEDIGNPSADGKQKRGRRRLLKQISEMLPWHDLYIEPAACNGVVLSNKMSAKSEIMNLATADAADAYSFIKQANSADMEWLGNQTFAVSKELVQSLKDQKANTLRQRFYKFLYLQRARNRAEPRLSAEQYRSELLAAIPKIKERLSRVSVSSGDWREALAKSDTVDAVIFLDSLGARWRTDKSNGNEPKAEKELLQTLRAIKGRFLLTYEISKAEIFREFRCYKIEEELAADEPGPARAEMLVSNFPISIGRI